MKRKEVSTSANSAKTESTVSKLVRFANQKPGLDFNNYGDWKAFKAEMNEITKDLHDFRELLGLAVSRLGCELEGKLTDYLKRSSGRLTMNEKGIIEYCAGQYYCTEYRPAANRVLAGLIWADYSNETEKNSPNPIYTTGAEIRAAIRKRISRRVMQNYFN